MKYEKYHAQANEESAVRGYLCRYHLALKLTIDGAQSYPFTAIALPPNEVNYGLKEKIKEASREKYAEPRDVIESKLEKWANQKYNKNGNLIQKSWSEK